MGYVNNPTLLAAGDIVLGLALIPELTFLAIYMTTAKWWKTAIGRMFVIAQVAIVLVSLVVLASLIFGQTYPGRDWIRLLGYSAHFAGQIVFLVTYLVERRTPASRHRIPKTRMDTRS
jgi:hypothetical protein